MTRGGKLIISILLCLLLAAILSVTLNSCSIVRKHRTVEKVKVDSTATSLTVYDRETTTETIGSDSISNPVTPFVAPLNTEDTTKEITYSTDLFDLSIKPGKNGKVSVTPKDNKLPVPKSASKTTTKEKGTNIQSVNVEREEKTVVKDKEANRFPAWLGIAGVILISIVLLWLVKKYIY